MFKSDNQSGLFSFKTRLRKMQQDLLENLRGKCFYNLILRNINKDNFKPLFSKKSSRPFQVFKLNSYLVVV